MVKVISFDTATKSLAVSIIEYDLNYVTEIEKVYNDYLNYKNECIIKLTNKKRSKSQTNDEIISDLLTQYIYMFDTVTNLINNKLI